MTGATALCAVPLLPEGSTAITPLPLLFLVFWVPGGEPPKPGTVLDTCPGAGILIDLSTTPNPVLTYRADATNNYGWGWDPAAGGITAYNVGDALPALLNPPASP